MCFKLIGDRRLFGGVCADEPKVKASVETMAYNNMILTEAIFQLLEERGY